MKKLERDISFLNGNAFPSIPVPTNFGQCTSLAYCTKEVTDMEYAKLFVDHVFRLHSLPEVIISDRDPHFTGKFWKSLFDLLSTDLRFNMIFHP